MTDAIRTPDELLLGLPEFPFESSYREFDGFRLAHVDVGDGPQVVFLHGEPTWSFLWRRVIPLVRDAGYRCIAPDLPGFGRSDKPIDIGWYTYDTFVASIASLFEELDLRDATVVVHDWGGPIGLRVAVERCADRIARIVVLDTGLFTGHQPMNEAWMRFRAFVERTEDLPVGLLVRRACLNDPGDDVIAAYDAPFPNAASKAGARAFPLILPLSPDAPGADAGQRVLDALRDDPRPKLFLWGDSDPVLPLEPTGRRFAAALGGSQIDHVIPGASHFLQEDAGPAIGRLIADWLQSGP
jgi:haloalkane dehalogenase